MIGQKFARVNKLCANRASAQTMSAAKTIQPNLQNGAPEKKKRTRRATTPASAKDAAFTQDRGVLAPNPHQDLEGWAQVTLRAMRERTVKGLIDLREERDQQQHAAARGGDEADVCAERDEHTARIRSMEVLQARLTEIDAAIGRLQRGEYGLCEETGETIAVERLRANPLARYTVEAQEHKERSASLFSRGHAN